MESTIDSSNLEQQCATPFSPTLRMAQDDAMDSERTFPHIQNETFQQKSTDEKQQKLQTKEQLQELKEQSVLNDESRMVPLKIESELESKQKTFQLQQQIQAGKYQSDLEQLYANLASLKLENDSLKKKNDNLVVENAKHEHNWLEREDKLERIINHADINFSNPKEQGVSDFFVTSCIDQGCYLYFTSTICTCKCTSLM